MNFNKRKLIILIAISVAMSGMVLALQNFFLKKEPIKVGIISAVTGRLAVQEALPLRALLLEIEEINKKKGGLLGREIVPVIADTESQLFNIGKETKRLIKEEKVSVIFGVGSSAVRKSIKPIVERYNHLLVYSGQCEGLEESKNIVYVGAAPNQQILPVVKWSYDNLGKKMFIIGAETLFSRIANEIIKDQLKILGAELVGIEYLKSNGENIEEVVGKVSKSKAEVILNTVDNNSDINFFDEIDHIDITPEYKPIVLFDITESKIKRIIDNLYEKNENAKHIIEKHIAGNYACKNYFQTIHSEKNQHFLEEYYEKYGKEAIADDYMEAAYLSVYLWSQAVRDAGTDEPKEVIKTIKKQSAEAPEGMVHVDAETNYVWKTVRIGKIRKDGRFNIIWSSGVSVKPVPFPKNRSKNSWQGFLKSLYYRWGRKWEL